MLEFGLVCLHLWLIYDKRTIDFDHSGSYHIVKVCPYGLCLACVCDVLMSSSLFTDVLFHCLSV